MPARYAAAPTDVEAFAVKAASEKQPRLAALIRRQFGVSRTTAHNYISSLVERGLIRRISPGLYGLASTETMIRADVAGLEEHELWENSIQPLLNGLPANAITIWAYGCTEMINNVIDHSESPTIRVSVKRMAKTTEVDVDDSGVGIFRKIARALHLEDDRHAVLELSKGKVTTDPANHTGEGIFFSSRAFDSFRILSGGVFFAHDCELGDEDWILGDERPVTEIDGTSVSMILSNNTERKLQDIFDEYATDTEEYRFDRTVVPVKLLEYGDDHLVSRSQAKRLLSRFDRFKTVVLNFENVESIGQAFADEVFRVFPSQHPEVEILAINANEQVTRMMNRARSGREPQPDLFSDKG